MKSIHVFIAVILMFSVCGCVGKNKDTAVTTTSEFKTADQLIQEAESRTQKEILAKDEKTFGECAGIYFCDSEQVSKEYWPSVELTIDGKAIFKANLLTGMGELRGSYVVDNDMIKMVVEEVSFTGFSGENITDMVFKFTTENTMELDYTTPSTTIGITQAGDFFTKSAK